VVTVPVEMSRPGEEVVACAARRASPIQIYRHREISLTDLITIDPLEDDIFDNVGHGAGRHESKRNQN